MRTFVLDFLGRKYRIETTLGQDEIAQIETRIKEDFARFEAKYPRSDRIDIFIFYLIELWERIFILERRLGEGRTRWEFLQTRLKKIAERVEKHVKQCSLKDRMS